MAEAMVSKEDRDKDKTRTEETKEEAHETRISEVETETGKELATRHGTSYRIH